MDLSSALGLRNEIDGFFATRRGRGKARKFALGVAIRSATDFRVAVRAAVEADYTDKDRRAVETLAGDTEPDVKFVGEIKAASAHALVAKRGISIGASIAHPQARTGTLGFFARRDADGTIGFVSNNHVIAAEDCGREDDPILYMTPDNRRRSEGTVIGYLDSRYPRLKQKDENDFAIADCAFARLAAETAYDPSSLHEGMSLSAVTALPYAAGEVCKVGRTTGMAKGKITSFALDPVVRYSFGHVKFRNQIEIDSTTGVPFSLGGDSGSLVFSRTGQPVGLVFALSAIEGTNNCGLTYAHPIDSVLEALEVTVLT